MKKANIEENIISEIFGESKNSFNKTSKPVTCMGGRGGVVTYEFLGPLRVWGVIFRENHGKSPQRSPQS